MNLTRRLTEGIGAWLHFEFACNRSGLFNERYLSTPVGQILSASFGDRIHSDFEHPILAPMMKGSGRRPAIDFAYCESYPKIKVAVETKWAGSTHATPENIIWDLIRLEMIAHHHGAECIFILAGERSKLKRLFNLVNFSGPKSIHGRQPILKTSSNSLTKLSLLADKHYRIPLLKKVYLNRQDIPIPHRIMTRRSKPFPEECKNGQYQVYSWHIQPMEHRLEFKPSNSKHFRALTNNADSQST